MHLVFADEEGHVLVRHQLEPARGGGEGYYVGNHGRFTLAGEHVHTINVLVRDQLEPARESRQAKAPEVLRGKRFRESS